MHKTVQLACYGRDTTLLETRKMVIEQAGFRMETAKRYTEFLGIVERQSIDVVILCHSLDPNECQQALQVLNERSPTPPVILLTAGDAHYEPHVSPRVVNAMEGPRALLAAIMQVAGSIRAGLSGQTTQQS